MDSDRNQNFIGECHIHTILGINSGTWEWESCLWKRIPSNEVDMRFLFQYSVNVQKLRLSTFTLILVFGYFKNCLRVDANLQNYSSNYNYEDEIYL